MFSSRKMKIQVGASALLVAAGMGVALADTTNIPASTCVATGSGVLAVRSDGQVENQSASAVTAVCPVDRKQINGNFTTVFSGRVWVADQHSTANVCCKVISRNPSSGASVEGTQVCSSNEGSGAQSLTLPSLTDNTTFSHFYIQCTLPAFEGAASRLLTVRATQD
jgi:hypothetical protein